MKHVTVLLLTTSLIAGCVTSDPKMSKKDDEAAASYNLQLGIDYFQQGNLSQAKEKLDRSLQQNSKNAQTYVVAGMLYERLNESRKADQYFDRAISLEPKNGEVLNTYAVYLCRKKEFIKGEQMALRAANDPLYKTPEAAWYNAGNCAMEALLPSKAEGYFRRAVMIRPNFAAALLQLAQLEFKAGNLLPARGFLERFNQANKPTAGSLWLAVQIERASGNVGVAADYARRLQQDFPTSLETKALLGSVNISP